MIAFLIPRSPVIMLSLRFHDTLLFFQCSPVLIFMLQFPSTFFFIAPTSDRPLLLPPRSSYNLPLPIFAPPPFPTTHRTIHTVIFLAPHSPSITTPFRHYARPILSSGCSTSVVPEYHGNMAVSGGDCAGRHLRGTIQQSFHQTYVSDLSGTHIQIYAAATDLEICKFAQLHNLCCHHHCTYNS
jgi:hypothetical protein